MEPNNHQYKIQFRCPNCGDVFSKVIQKGTPAEGKGGHCPTCGVSDGQPNVGRFTVVKNHPELDEPIRPYNSPRM